MLFDRQETLSRVLESTTAAFVRFRYKAFLKLHFTLRNRVPLHFNIRNRVPYNKPLTNRACSVSTVRSGRTIATPNWRLHFYKYNNLTYKAVFSITIFFCENAEYCVIIMKRKTETYSTSAIAVVLFFSVQLVGSSLKLKGL